jgi:hypothetical protein
MLEIHFSLTFIFLSNDFCLFHPLQQNLIHLPDEPAGVWIRCVTPRLAKESSSPATPGGRGRPTTKKPALTATADLI